MVKSKSMNMPQASAPKESITEMIRKRAQQISEKRGGAPGNDWADWFEAERQIKGELKK
jgi:hypothetical protein